MGSPANGKMFLIMVVLTVLCGCTRSFEAHYKQGMQPIVVKKQQDGNIPNVGIAKFEDKRSFIRASDKKSSAYVATQSPWQFGLTYNNRQFIPVADFLQDVFISEFNNAGLKASKAGTEENFNYVLSGQIINFEFANDAGMWRVTSRRTVTVVLDLKRADSSTVFAGQLFNETDTENEGMGVLHTTNVDKLVNTVLKKVIVNVTNKVAESLAINATDVIIRFDNPVLERLASSH